MIVYVDECFAAGIDPEIVRRLARRIERAALELQKIGVEVFGGSGHGSLRFDDRFSPALGSLILASLNGRWDGGDGGFSEAEDGLTRGER